MIEGYDSLKGYFCNGHLRLVLLILISWNLIHLRRRRLTGIKNYSGPAAAGAEERKREEEGEQQEEERIDVTA